jgi:hypothetical protein
MDFTRTRSIAAHVATASAMLVCLAVIVGVGRADRVVTAEPHAMAESSATVWKTASLETGAAVWTTASFESTAAPLAVAPLAAAPDAAVVEAPVAEAETAATVIADLPPPIVVNNITLAAFPLPDAASAEPGSDVVGLWAPDVASCSLKGFHQGLLPTIITTEGAWAGETFCTFKSRKPTESGWRVTADCASDKDRWTTQVRLSLKGQHLIWESKRGRQVYTRCGTDVHMAAVPQP